jgi:tryptophanyl-tRNA synthetase
MGDKKKILSCIQPTGNVHLGNYFGAIENWVNLQQEYDTYYGIVNYHAQTMPYNPAKLRALTWDVAFRLHACGIKIENIFIQSLVPEHTELAWVLNCMCSYGELTRMTQFKDKSAQLKASDKDYFVSAGLFTYPVLQAADILIYKPNFVPVGKDQEQHLELTRNIATRFNAVVGQDFFPIPEALFTKVPKVMSTADPTRKMSSSMGEKHNIDLFADPAKITKQIKSAVTDSGDVKYPEISPGIENLFSIMKATGATELYDQMMQTYKEGNLSYGDLKNDLAEVIVEFTKPFRVKLGEILSDKKYFKNEIKKASYQTRQVAQETIKEVRTISGLI